MPDLLYFNPVFERLLSGERSFKNARRRVDIYVYLYSANDGEQYRFSFEVKRGECPTVPSNSAGIKKAEIAAAKYQY